MNNCTLIIDGNWLLMSRLGIVIKNFDKQNTPDTLQRAQDDLVDFLAQSVNKIINYFDGCIDNILMVQDGGSWRKSFPKPKLYTDVYKGNRESDEEIEWTYIWNGLNQFCQNFHREGITCTQERSIEGDDWIWFWSRQLNQEGCNVIIWSSDCDLKQLIQYDEINRSWTAWFNDRAGLWIHDRFDTSSMSDADLFMFEFDAIPRTIASVINNVSMRGDKVNYINPDDIRMEKIICGDAGDNIKSVVRTETHKIDKKTGKEKTIVKRVSEKEWNAIKENMDISNLEEFLEAKDDILKTLKQLSRHKSNKDSYEDISEMFQYNLHMVILDEKYIPEEQKNLMLAQRDDYKMIDLNYLKNNYKVLGSRSNQQTIENIFEDIPDIDVF